MTLVLDTHALLWATAAPDRLSPVATGAIAGADEIAVASITWWEVASLARRGRVTPHGPLDAWLRDLAREVRTVALTPAIAARAVSLPASFARDPSDRIIYATAVEHGLRLVTADRAMHQHDARRRIVVW